MVIVKENPQIYGERINIWYATYDLPDDYGMVLSPFVIKIDVLKETVVILHQMIDKDTTIVVYIGATSEQIRTVFQLWKEIPNLVVIAGKEK